MGPQIKLSPEQPWLGAEDPHWTTIQGGSPGWGLSLRKPARNGVSSPSPGAEGPGPPAR